MAVTRLGWRIYTDELVERTDPWGRRYFWIGGEAPHGHAEPGTDIAALAEGRISVTPIHLDMTAHALLEEVGTRDWAAILGGVRANGDESQGSGETCSTDDERGGRNAR